jgi:hypothetical protein
VSIDGAFAWQRRSIGMAWVYVEAADGSVRSNTVTIR